MSYYFHGFEVASLGEVEKVRAVNQTIPIIFWRTRPTQFGIEEMEIPKVLQLIDRYPSLTLEGFHFHAMSNNLDARKHARFVQYCVEKVKEWEKEFQLKVSYVNAGGGIGINYTETTQQFDWELFADELSKEFNKKGAPYTVLFELGRYIAASSGYYVTEILDIKQNHGKTFAVVRGGTHHLRLPAAWKMNHPFTVIPVNEWPYPFERPQLEGEAVTIAGELCTPNDILARDIPVKQLRAGDVLLFQYAGAYGWVISHHDFLSHPHPELLFLE